MTDRCNIPARTLPPCDLERGHDGAMHANAGDGFYAREYDDEHKRRQVERAECAGWRAVDGIHRRRVGVFVLVVSEFRADGYCMRRIEIDQFDGGSLSYSGGRVEALTPDRSDKQWDAVVGKAKTLCEKAARDAGLAVPSDAPLSDGEARAMLLRLGLPVEACMAMRRVCGHGAKKHGCRPGESAPTWTVEQHLDHACGHIDNVYFTGKRDLRGKDAETGEMELAHAMTRLALAIGVLCG